jgi:hypothetical protein
VHGPWGAPIRQGSGRERNIHLADEILTPSDRTHLANQHTFYRQSEFSYASAMTLSTKKFTRLIKYATYSYRAGYVEQETRTAVESVRAWNGNKAC